MFSFPHRNAFVVLAGYKAEIVVGSFAVARAVGLQLLPRGRKGEGVTGQVRETQSATFTLRLLPELALSIKDG